MTSTIGYSYLNKLKTRYNIDNKISNDIKNIINSNETYNESIVQYILDNKINSKLEDFLININQGIAHSNLDVRSKSKLRGYIISRIQSELINIFE